MTTYRVFIHDRSYCRMDLYLLSSTASIPVPSTDELYHLVNPRILQLFHDDVIRVTEKKEVQVLNSPVREKELQSMPGVLILTKTHGVADDGSSLAHSSSSSSPRRSRPPRFLYQCIPYNPHLPSFLIPYTLPQIGFGKVHEPLFVLFKFARWSSQDMHPRGVLTHTMGPVSDLAACCEYEMHGRNLYVSPAAGRAVCDAIATSTRSWPLESPPTRPLSDDKENRTRPGDYRVVTVDKQGTACFDDAFSVQQASPTISILSVYIADIMDFMERHELWSLLSTRAESIYLPHKCYPMLPAALATQYGSLSQHQLRTAIAVDFFVHAATGEVLRIQFARVSITVAANLFYGGTGADDEYLDRDPTWKSICELAKQMHAQKHSVPFAFHESLEDPANVVAFLMIATNAALAKELRRHETGIYCRSQLASDRGHLPDVLQAWRSEYVSYSEETLASSSSAATALRHEPLMLDEYVPMTCPLRRLPDLLNQIAFVHRVMRRPVTAQAIGFYDTWVANMDYLNRQVAQIKKLELRARLLSWMEKTPEFERVRGVVVETTPANRFSVFVPAWKMVVTATLCADLPEEFVVFFPQQPCWVYLYYFACEHTFRRKVRAQIRPLSFS